MCAVDIVGGGGIDRAVSHPSDGIGGWVRLWIRIWLWIRVRGVAGDVRDGHVASDLADGETSLKIIYTPTVLGTLVGEIDYQKYV